MKFTSSRTAELEMLCEGPRARRVDFGSRSGAAVYRQQIEDALDRGFDVSIDFAGVAATQSFIDEMIGVMVLQRGPAVLSSIRFKQCSDDVKAIVRFVASDRAAQYEAQHARPILNVGRAVHAY
jgi:hypothetical protein